MKIHALNLVNFRSHEKTDLAFDRLNLVLGANHSGKSSIAMALEYLLTGRCEATDEGGKGADDLIRKGQPACEVAADITVNGDSFEMARVKTQGGSTLELRRAKQSITGKQAQEWLAKRLPSLPVLSACLNSGRFLDMPVQGQKNLLSSVLADEGIPVPPELRWDESVERVSIAELDRVHKAAFERRTEINRKIKEFEALTAPEDLPENVPTVETVQSRIRGLRTERDNLITQKSQRVAAHEGLSQKREEIQRKLAILEPRILAMAEEKRLKSLADKTDAEASTKATKLRGQLEVKRPQIARLEKLGSAAICPTCIRALAKKELQDIIVAMKAEIAELDKQLQIAEQAERDYVAGVQYRKKIIDSISAVAEKEELVAELSKLPDVEAPDVSDLEGSITEIDSRISKGEGVLLDVNERRRKIKEHAEKVAARDRIQDELRHVEAMIQFAGPDGARKQATGDKLQHFNAALNTILPKFGYNVLILMEPFSIQVLREDSAHKALEVHQLSESERFRFSVAFQIALADLTNVGVVVIDRADILDRESRRQLTAMLMATECQAIVCSTTTDPIPSQVPEGVRFFRLEQQGGGATRLMEQTNHVEAVGAA